MTNFERTVTPDFFAETLGNLLESYFCDCADCPFNDFCNSLPTEMVSGFSCANIIKKWAKAKANILDEVEKEYLKNFLAPWLKRKDIKITIEKHKSYKEEKWWLEIILEKDCDYVEEEIVLPFFRSKKMYAGMEEDKYYTAEELGLR